MQQKDPFLIHFTGPFFAIYSIMLSVSRNSDQT
jgi:hypothetical protein